ncbi:MAG: hypothetical protein JO233_01490 [Candidatus Eremiobacteraeota bacterium]|nr:hypothetical protein [Candidatus Eremiobacteraeota bacterium]
MDVPSYEFLAFVGIIALVINISKSPQWRRAIFLIANLTFIASFTRDPAQLAPFAALLAFGYATVKMMERLKWRALFVAFITTAVIVFCWLKRYAFIPHALFLPEPYFVVGMSYVFFRILHLIIDAYQDALPDRVGLLSYVNYTLNFTALVSGPIQFYRDYLRTESKEPLPLEASAIGYACQRIIIGLLKVTIVSPLLFFAHQRCVALLAGTLPAVERLTDAALILAIFPVYIYFNFSGYMDVVIGCARFLRLELPENFNRPFLSEGFIEFWGRWHMTLSNWIKTYVYSPLLLNLMRRFSSRRAEAWLSVFAYFVAFFLIGVWHGQTSMFIFLGILFGLGVSVNKLYQLAMMRQMGRPRYRALCANPLYSSLSRGLTFAWFAFSSLWFWANWSQLAGWGSTLGVGGVALAFLMVLIAAAVLLSALAQIDQQLKSVSIGERWFATLGYLRTAWYTALAVITVSVAVLLNAPAPHIIYKGF